MIGIFPLDSFAKYSKVGFFSFMLFIGNGSPRISVLVKWENFCHKENEQPLVSRTVIYKVI